MIRIYHQVVICCPTRLARFQAARDSCVLTEHIKLRLTREDNNHAIKKSDTMI